MKSNQIKCFPAPYKVSSDFKDCLSQGMQTTGTKQIQQDNCNQAASGDSVLWDFGEPMIRS